MMYAVWFMGYDQVAAVEEVFASEAEAEAYVEGQDAWCASDEMCWYEEVEDDFEMPEAEIIYAM